MTRFLRILLGASVALAVALGVTPTHRKTRKKGVQPHASGAAKSRKPSSLKVARPVAVSVPAKTSAPAKAPARPLRVRRSASPWDVPTYADSTVGDVLDGEDLQVRRAAVDALGRFNGAVVVVDPNSGRILSMVNQRLALTGAYQPCSTIKLWASLAALSEGMIDKDTRVRISRGVSMDLTTAIARSNNVYFSNLGEKLGFDKIQQYGRLYGLGEKAGYGLDGESPGIFPDRKPREIPVGMMTSFGEAIGITPLQLAALVTSIANDGTLYFLQYPRNEAEIEHFTPRVKRFLDIREAVPKLKPGMLGATDFGTARRASYDPSEPIFGKTGTCSDARTHLGWFGSFNEVAGRKLVVVVLLTGGSGVNGPVASGVAGQVYKNLSQQHYFAPRATASVAGQP
jgi:cell division protein FtsI/penicillin-binding protein 2